ncbi:MAG: hypothetical protein GY786_01075 [Proteobacteria bacterium]|nr:hypothetical protein [Pseudomonadota bacterium]
MSSYRDPRKLYFVVKLFDFTLENLNKVSTVLDTNEYFLDSVIKRFELALDQGLKAMKEAIMFQDKATIDQNELLDSAQNLGFIKDRKIWDAMLEAQVQVREPYDLKRSEHFCEEILFFLDPFMNLNQNLKKFCLEIDKG